MLSKRETFEKVKLHLLTQNEKSMKDYDTCWYRGSNNTSCAVGCLIKDEYYSIKFEDVSIPDSKENIPYSYKEKTLLLLSSLEKSNINTDEDTLDLLRDLQFVHDYDDVADWSDSLDKVESQHFNNEEN